MKNLLSLTNIRTPNPMNTKKTLTLLITGLLFLLLLPEIGLSHGMSEAEKQSIIEGGNLRYIWLGATHMLSGYDHLAFVFGIIFFLTTFRDIAKYVTAFTIGHSITLIYATFNGIQFNYFLIDAVIGLSVSYIAFANLDGFRKYLNINPPNMMLMIIGLGLIHGFGLSTRLQELPLSEDALLMNIISFNIGIELGQISALAIMLILIATWRKAHTFKTFSLIANYSLILMGGFLFLMQMHGYEHTTNSEEFVINTASAEAVNKTASSSLTGMESSKSVVWEDTITIVIPARGDKEYKLLLTDGAMFEFLWKTEGELLFYDFHGEPSGDTTGYFKSFKKDTSNSDVGILTASFKGTHGWYWKNNTTKLVQITLNLKGQYTRLDVKEQLKADTSPLKRENTHDTID